MNFTVNMKRPPNLNEEIAAMAKSDSNGMPTIAIENHRSRDDEKLSNVNSHNPSSMDSKRKRKKNRSQLVQTIRISVSISDPFRFSVEFMKIIFCFNRIILFTHSRYLKK